MKKMFELVRIYVCVWFHGRVYVFESVDVFLDVEDFTYVESKWIWMVSRSYVGQFKMRTHGKVGVGHVSLRCWE